MHFSDKHALPLVSCASPLNSSHGLLTSVSLRLGLDAHSHRFVPQSGPRVWGHQSHHNGREPGCWQHCHRPVWKPNMRVLRVRCRPIMIFFFFKWNVNFCHVDTSKNICPKVHEA